MKKYLLLMLLLLVSCTTKDDIIDFRHSNTVAWQNNEEQLLILINNYRTQLGLPELIKDDYVYELARDVCYQTIGEYEVNGELNHHVSTLQVLILDSGLKVIRENLAYGYPTLEGVFSAWIESQPHQVTITENWKWTGISILQNNEGRYFYVQLFATDTYL